MVTPTCDRCEWPGTAELECLMCLPGKSFQDIAVTALCDTCVDAATLVCDECLAFGRTPPESSSSREDFHLAWKVAGGPGSDSSCSCEVCQEAGEPLLTRAEYRDTMLTEEEMAGQERRDLLLGGGQLAVPALLLFAVIGGVAGLGAGGLNADLVTSLVCAVLAVGGVPILLKMQRKRCEVVEAATEKARAWMRERLPEDPLDWPAWTLDPECDLLKKDALKALGVSLGSPRHLLLVTRAGEPGTVRDQFEVVKASESSGFTRAATAPEVPAAPRHTVGLDVLARRHEKLSTEYGEYLCDPVRVLREPLLNDVSDPLTSEFVEAYAVLTETPAPVAGDDTRAYEQALERAWKSWRVASAQARKVGLGVLPENERKKVRTAQRLLALALDPGTSDAERASAYAQVQKLVAGLVELPEAAQLAVETKLRGALTA